MLSFTEMVVSIESGKLTMIEKVSKLKLIVSGLEIDTPSELTRRENAKGVKITRPGMIKSKRYAKEYIGKQLFCIAGMEETGLPF